MTVKDVTPMKTLDLIAAALLFIGGLNWGLVGLFGFNLVASIFGSMSVLTRIIYLLVGVAAVYDAVLYSRIKERWECRGEYLDINERPTA